MLSSGVVVATDGKGVACWSRAGSLLQERSLGDPTTYDPDARYFTPDGGSCESLCLAPDATEVLFGGEGGDFASFEVVAKSCESENSGEVIAKMRVGGPRFTGRVSQIAFSRSGQYVANLNTSPDGELDPRIPVWRGRRFLAGREGRAHAPRFAGFAAHAADRQRPGAQRAAAVSRANNNFYSMR